MNLRWSFAAVLLLGLAVGAASALMDPDLVQRLDKLDGNEMLPVQVVLKDQFDPGQLASLVQGMPKDIRRARVGRILMDYAEPRQRPLIDWLEQEQAAGRASDIHPLWLVNAVGCWATKAAILALDSRPDVDLVYCDRMPVEITPIDIQEIVEPDVTDGVEPNMVVTNVRGAWAQGYHGEGIVIGVVDTGVRYTHDDIENHVWTSSVYPNPGFNFASNQYSSGHPGPSTYDTLTPLDYYGHGTHCAGIATADGTYGNGTRDTMGVAPSAKIMACAVDVYLHSPYPDTSMENNTMAGMQFCVRPPRDTLNGADLITMSLGLITSWSPRYAVWRRAEEAINVAGLPHMVAAGNEGASGIRTSGNCPPPWRNPVNHPSHPGDTAKTCVITIGATDNSDVIASFSSRGPTTIWGSVAPWNDYENPPGLMDPDVCMPGVDILSTYYSNDRSYTTMSGTSMATPGSAGCVALMLSKNPNLEPWQIDSILELHCVKDLGPTGKDNTYGAGRLNCSLAVAMTPLPNDVGCTRILAPTGTVDSGSVVTPHAWVKNFVGIPVSAPVRLTIGTGYDDTVQVMIPANDSANVAFDDWTALTLGVHAVRCSTMLSGDANPSNDLAIDSVTVRSLVGIEEPGAPASSSLDDVRPNPFSRSAAISFAVAAPGRCRVAVYDVHGRLVRKLVDATMAPGRYSSVWDGTDERGRSVADGVYYVRLAAGEYRSSRQVQLTH